MGQGRGWCDGVDYGKEVYVNSLLFLFLHLASCVFATYAYSIHNTHYTPN